MSGSPPHNLPARPLKSTAAHYAYPGVRAKAQPPPLPPGWTEHKAPTGHPYFYHAATETSTYTRPVAPPTPQPIPLTHASPTQFPYAAAVLSGTQYPGPPFTHGMPTTPIPTSNFPHYPHQQQQQEQQHHFRGRGGPGVGGRPFQPHRSQPPAKPDRPKRKRPIPNAAPWVFVTTKLGREFVHNPETKQSLWMGKAPEEVIRAVEALKKLSSEELGRLDEEEKKARELRRAARANEKGKGRGEDQEEEAEESEYEEVEEESEHDQADTSHEGPRGRKRSASAAELSDNEAEAEGDEYEEEEYEEDHEDTETRPRWDGGNPSASSAAAAPVEFTEDDIAWQLEAMAEEYGLDDEDLIQTSDLPASDAVQIFQELLDEVSPNPYSTWENTYPSLAHDPRYTVLNTTKYREEVFTSWCKTRIAALKEEKLKQERKDPKILYLDFLSSKTKDVKKLYWQEFKRKYKKEKEMKDVKISDKDREKIYRDFATHLKISPGLMENELRKLLKANRSSLSSDTSLEELPLAILTDVRYAAYPTPGIASSSSESNKSQNQSPLPPRDEIIKSYLSTLPSAADMQPAPTEKEIKERQRAEAILERERMVRREKARLRVEMERGKELLRGEEMEIERAVREVGRKGLLSSIEAEREKEKEKGKAMVKEKE